MSLRNSCYYVNTSYICDALRDLVPFVSFKNVKNTHGGVTKINTPPWVVFTFLKLYKWYQIAQRTTNYWLVSLLPVCKKIFERLLFYEVFRFLTESELISSHHSATSDKIDFLTIEQTLITSETELDCS